jgi:hypothetical protein
MKGYGMSASRGSRARALLLGLVLVLAAAPGLPALAEQQSVGEYKVKAAFLYNFTKFVEWPDQAFPDAAAPFVIAVLGDDPFGDALDILKGKTAQGRPIVVRRIASLAEVTRVNILFVASSEKSRLGSVLPAAEAMHALTVGDAQGFRSQGGMIQLVRDGDKVGFEVNLDASRRAELKISSKLLTLAKAVSGVTGK